GVTVPIFLRLGNRARSYTPNGAKPGVGTFRDVALRDIVAENTGEVGCSITGLAGHPIREVLLENIKLGFDGGQPKELASRTVPERADAYPESVMFGTLPAYGFYCRHVEGLTFRNVELHTRQPDLRHAMVFENVQGLTIDSLNAAVAEGGVPALRMTDVDGAEIRDGQPAERDTRTIPLRSTGCQPVAVQSPERATYTNPIMDGTLADPAVILHDGVYYLYATGEVDGDNGYRVYTSTDLIRWKRGPVVFRPGQRHIWAPDVWRDPDTGRFYLYYTANKTVGVAEAAGPEGPFAITRKLVDQAIDAHLFRDDDGRLYLYYVTLPGFRITVQPMASPTEPAGDARVILQPESEWETRNGRVTEGPWIIKHDGRYYLLYSGSGADTPDYAVGYATSRSPLGPFVRADHNPILHRGDGVFGPGHGGAIQDAEGAWWYVYHQKNSDRRAWDRFICIDRLHFDEQGRLNGRATRAQPQPAPATGDPEGATTSL
ncbi:MAG: glycoside hydrolase family 43 protein, partial [Pirellulaceae bacterium]|nr:glycoside hydrolase family 43 protein [Pirellulaceae bacterium]